MGSSVRNDYAETIYNTILATVDETEEGGKARGTDGVNESEQILNGEGLGEVTGSGRQEKAENPIAMPPPDKRVLGDERDVAEHILDNCLETNKLLNKGIAEVKKHSGMAKAMLKASGIDLGPISKVFFDIFALMALMIETAQRQREAGREMRQLSLEAVVASIEKQADKQLQAAGERRNAAMMSAGMSIAMGVASMGLAGFSGAQGLKSMGVENQADMLDEIADPVLDAAQTGTQPGVQQAVDGAAGGAKGLSNQQNPQSGNIEITLEEGGGKNEANGVDKPKEQTPAEKIQAAKDTIAEWGKTWDGETKPPAKVTQAARTLKNAGKALHKQAKSLEIKQARFKQVCDGLMSMAKGVGEIFSASMNMKAEMYQIEATREQVNQKTAEASMQDATEAMQAAQELINTVIRAMMQIKAAEIEMMKTASFA